MLYTRRKMRKKNVRLLSSLRLIILSTSLINIKTTQVIEVLIWTQLLKRDNLPYVIIKIRRNMSMISTTRNALISHKLISLVRKILVFGEFKTKMKSKVLKSSFNVLRLEDSKMKLWKLLKITVLAL